MDWRVDVLRQLNAPATSANLRFMSDWQRMEGGHTNNSARWNWLNSTLGNYPTINSVGVRAYPDYQTGVRQTAATIRNGRYPALLQGLRKGDPYSQPGVEGDLSTWVSGSSTGNLSYSERVLGRASEAVSAGTDAATGAVAGCGTTLLWLVATWVAVIELIWKLHGII